MLKRFEWDPEKNEKLKAERGVGFEEIEKAINSGDLLAEIDHPNRIKYPHQKVLLVKFNNYIYLVPFVEDNEKRFLKTLYKSRKATKKYLGRRENEKKVSK